VSVVTRPTTTRRSYSSENLLVVRLTTSVTPATTSMYKLHHPPPQHPREPPPPPPQCHRRHRPMLLRGLPTIQTLPLLYDAESLTTLSPPVQPPSIDERTLSRIDSRPRTPSTLCSVIFAPKLKGSKPSIPFSARVGLPPAQPRALKRRFISVTTPAQEGSVWDLYPCCRRLRRHLSHSALVLRSLQLLPLRDGSMFHRRHLNCKDHRHPLRPLII